MVIRRHPIRAIFGGLIMGLGVALALVFAGIAPVGEWSVIVLIVAGIVIGLLWAYLAPARTTVTTTTATSSGPSSSPPPPPG